MRLAPSASASAAACAAIHEKIPVVMGQAKPALCFFARAARSSLIVTRRPFGTWRINASISRGAGMTIGPVPQRCDILPVTKPTFGRPLSSASFSRQEFFFFMSCGCVRQNAANQKVSRLSQAQPRKSKMRDHFNLHVRALGQRGDLHRGTRREIAGEIL